MTWSRRHWWATTALVGGAVLPLSLGQLASAQELPTGGAFVHGQGTIGQSGPVMGIDQSSATGVINWNSFSIGAGGTVNIDNGAGATLNRVTGQNLSEIYGTLNATGSAYLINENGIVIGASGVVSTGGSFVASTLDISDDDFVNGGDQRFAGAGGSMITNAGQVTAGQDVMMFARQVQNAGSITAGGVAGLAAGQEILLQETGVNGQRVFVQAGTPTAGTGVDNTGMVEAAAAEVRAAGGNIYSLAVNNSGLVRATGLGDFGGQVTLASDGGDIDISGTVEARHADGSGGFIGVDGGADSTVLVSGRLDASGAAGTGSRGGEIRVEGDRVGALEAALFDASGDAGGGAIYFGGGFQGSDPAIRNATAIGVNEASRFLADARLEGDGGEIILWSEEATRFYGHASVKGAGVSGDGGLVEVSSGEWLDFAGTVDLSGAGDGAAGLLLLDPSEVKIVASGTAGGSFLGGNWNSSATTSTIAWSLILSTLKTGDVQVDTISTKNGSGDIIIVDAVNATGTNAWNNDLYFLAQGDIEVNASINNDGDGGLHFYAGWIGGNGGVTADPDPDLGVQGEVRSKTLYNAINGKYVDLVNDGVGNASLKSITVAAGADIRTGGDLDLITNGAIQVGGDLKAGGHVLLFNADFELEGT